MPAHDYGAYIWPAYILTGVVWAVLIGASLIQSARWRRRAESGSTK
ncbi:MAG TPA: heme exporter protein CcmD [Phenylobacterium sp.]|jgi:heme exporter protein CcmD